MRAIRFASILHAAIALADPWLQLCSPAECVSGETLLQVLAHLEHRSCLSQPSVTRPRAGDNFNKGLCCSSAKLPQRCSCVLCKRVFLEHYMPGSHG